MILNTIIENEMKQVWIFKWMNNLKFNSELAMWDAAKQHPVFLSLLHSSLCVLSFSFFVSFRCCPERSFLFSSFLFFFFLIWQYFQVFISCFLCLFVCFHFVVLFYLFFGTFFFCFLFFVVVFITFYLPSVFPIFSVCVCVCVCVAAVVIRVPNLHAKLICLLGRRHFVFSSIEFILIRMPH